jgi:hypothetical protein
MRKPYTSSIRIRRKKPTTAGNRKLAAQLRAVLRNRRTRKADRLAAIEKLNLIAPPIVKPKEVSLGEQ